MILGFTGFNKVIILMLIKLNIYALLYYVLLTMN
jgi:hypothetical protein